MKENIPPLSEWSFNRLNSLYELCGKSFRACGREVGCTHPTFKKYYELAKKIEDCKKESGCGFNGVKEPEVTMPVTVTSVPTLIKKSKLNTRSASSKLFLDPDQMKVAVLDIETSSLKSDFGITICAVIHQFGTREDYKVFAIDLNEKDLLADEKKLLEALNAELEQFDGVVTYFGSRFDLPFIRTRSLYHGLKPLGKKKSLDLYFTVKRTTNPSSRRLERINDILRISDPDGSPDKTRLGMAEWNGVVFQRDTKQLDYVISHCVSDVKILENAVERFKDFLPDRIMRA